MAQPRIDAAPQVFVSRFGDMLGNMGDVLGLQLQVWSDGTQPLQTLDPPVSCLACSTRTPDLFSLCQTRRRSESRRADLAQKPATWTCENGLALAVLPIHAGGAAIGGLVAVQDLAPAANDPPGEAPSRAASGSGEPESAPDALTSVARAKAYEGLDPRSLSGGPADAGGAGEARSGEAGGGSEASFDRKLVVLKDWIRLVSDQMDLSSQLHAVSDELNVQGDELALLNTVTGRLGKVEDVRQTVLYILQQTLQMLDADAAAASVLDRKMMETKLRRPSVGSTALDSRAWHRLGTALRRTLTWSGNQSFSGRLSLLGDPQLDLPDEWQILAQGFPEGGQLRGYAAVICFRPQRKFKDGDLRRLRTLVNQIEVTTSNADLYDNLKSFLIATVKSLVHAIEAKDSITSGHSERVNILSMLLGRTMGLDEPTLEILRWASLLHDVGKIGMPECVLMKPGPLTSEEYDVIREHPERGYRILSPIQQLGVASDSVRAHHEMVNGQGYPFGLAGEEIPLLARIIAVADTYDALTQTRPYRAGRPIGAAMEEIRRVRGTQLDPLVLDSLEKLLPFLEENQIMIDTVSRAA